MHKSNQTSEMQVQRSPEANTQNDEAFMALLTSQRDLLSQLSKEKKTPGRGSRNQDKIDVSSKGAVAADVKGETIKVERRCSLNLSRRSSLEMVSSKCLSMGFDKSLDTCESVVCSLDFDILGDDLFEDFSAHTEKKESMLKGKKRNRRNSLTSLPPTFYDDFLKDASSLRAVIPIDDDDMPVSNYVDETGVESVVIKGKNDDSDTDDDDDDDKDVDATVVSDILDLLETPVPDLLHSSEESEEKENKEANEKSQPTVKVDPEKLQTTFTSFHKAMEISQQSQQSIHDWDRKMGLKRSHSKTMRQSMRSRKRLRTFFKKEISRLLEAKA